MPLDPNIPLVAAKNPVQSPFEMMGQAYEMAGAIEKQKSAQQQREDLNKTKDFLSAGGNLDTPDGIKAYTEWAKANLSPTGYAKAVEFSQGAEKNFLERERALAGLHGDLVKTAKDQYDIIGQAQNDVRQWATERTKVVGDAQMRQELPQMIAQKRQVLGGQVGPTGQPLYNPAALNEMLNPDWSLEQLNSKFESTAYGSSVLDKEVNRRQKEAEIKATQALEKERLTREKILRTGGPAFADEGLAEADRSLAAMGMSRQQVVGGLSKEATARWARAQSGAISDIQEEYGGIPKKEAARIFANRQQIRKADTSALQGLEKDISAITPYKEMLDLNADIAIGLSKKVTQTDVRFANKTLNWLRTNAGDNPDVAEFLAQNHFVTTEAARVLQNPRLVGQLTLEAQKEMRDVISGDMPVKSYERVLNRIKQDGNNRVDAMVRQRDRLLGLAEYESGAPTGMAAAAPPELRARTGAGQPAAVSPRTFAVPQGLPSGSKPIGRTPDKKIIWQTPDGKRYVE